MTLKSLLFIGTSICFLGLSEITAQNTGQSGRDTSQPITSSTPLKSIFSKDSVIIADNVIPKSKKRIKELNESIEKAIAEETSKESLMYPAIELYGEDSWNKDRVNPFAGQSSVDIPDTYTIDCTQFVHPLNEVRRINSHYGYRSRFRRMHYGIDLKLAVGDTVRSAFDGRVRMVSYERRGYGHYVVVRHPNGLETVYGHLSKTLVKPDQIVRAGEPIALGGNTGRSTGPHLHFETRFMGIPLNPEQIVDFHTGIPKSETFVFRKGKSSNHRTVASKGSSKGGSSDMVIHRIRKGDTLSEIAKKYGTTVSKLCRLNGISTRTTLRIGQTLRVS